MGDERLEGSRFGACHKNLALFLTMRPSLVGLNRPTSGRHSAIQQSCIDGAGGFRSSSW